jgi:hypothetical protein
MASMTSRMGSALRTSCALSISMVTPLARPDRFPKTYQV